MLKKNLAGTVTPPADMVEAAKKTLGPYFDEFVRKYPGEITPRKLVTFTEELRANGIRI